MRFYNKVVLPILGWVLIVLTAAGMTSIGLYKMELVDLPAINSVIKIAFESDAILISSFSVFAVIFIIAIRMTLGDKNLDSQREPILIDGEHGQVAIALETFENVVSLVLKDIAKITEYVVFAKKHDNDVEVLVKVDIAPDANITELVNNIQVKGMQEIEKVTGVKVKSIHVKVVNVTIEKKVVEKVDTKKQKKEVDIVEEKK